MTTPVSYTQLPAMARLVRLIESWPDVPSPMGDGQGEGDSQGQGSAVKRTELRDRLGRIITLDRADTARSISAPVAIVNQ